MNKFNTAINPPLVVKQIKLVCEHFYNNHVQIIKLYSMESELCYKVRKYFLENKIIL